MECGAEDFACIVFQWLKENDTAAAILARVLGLLSKEHGGVIGALSTIVANNFGTLITLGVFSYGLLRSWKYREAILHTRLAAYLAESDRRLAASQSEVLASMQRGSTERISQSPLYANNDLKSVLRERRWGLLPVASLVEKSAAWQLSRAINKLEHQLKTHSATVGSLHKQLASAHLLTGAIASTEAERAGRTDDSAALTSFRTVLALPVHEQHPLAKEFEALELRKLGLLAEARRANREAENMAQQFGDYRTQRLAKARAKRHQAEIRQLQNSQLFASGSRTFTGSAGANALISSNVDGSALKIRTNFAPYQKWELLDQADLHFLAAFVAHNLGNTPAENQQLSAAQTTYQELKKSIKPMWFEGREQKFLREKADSGLRRAEDLIPLQVGQRNYDWRWLLSVK